MSRLLLLLAALLASLHTVAAPGKLAIIIDDVGYNRALGERTLALPGPYTLAFLPFTPHARQLALQASQSGKELLLHAPMSNLNGQALGPGALSADMSYGAFTHTLRQSIADIPGVVGVNNHMGSLLTQQPQPMGWVMGEVARHNLFFIDSRTSAASIARQTAERYGIASASRDVFLDHSRNIADIEAELQRAVQLARQQGSAIAIGHPLPETLAVLEAASDRWQEWGVELVPASALLQSPPGSRGQCPAPPPLLQKYVPKPDKTAPLKPFYRNSDGFHPLGLLYKNDITFLFSRAYNH